METGVLEREIERKRVQLDALREIGKAINSAWGLESSLELITRRTSQVMGMDSCSIYLLGDNPKGLVLKASTGRAVLSPRR